MKKHFLFAAALFVALSLSFVSCENPDDEPGFSLENVGQDDANSDKENAEPMLVATGGATDVEYSCVTLWGRLNTDSLPMVGNVTGWGIEYAYNRESVESHKHSETTKVKCTTELQGENADEFSIECAELTGGVTIYYSAYALVDMKYIYGELDSVHLDVKLTASSNNTSYGTVTGSGTYDYLAEVSITATLKDNCYFTGWSDCDSKELSRTITLTSDSTITANFAKMSYLTVKINNSNFGTVEGSGYYEPNTEVTITATPNYYTEFVQWRDGNTENPRTVTITSDVTYIAEFAISYTSNFTPAVFSVSADKQVYFSSANLQYHPKNDEWRFAPSQLDYIGDGNENISSTYNGWLDLFGWSTSANNFGVSTSKDDNDYSGSFVDWGRNQIGDDAPNTWRTLTYDEWYYLRYNRTNANDLYGVAQVNGVNGLIFLPDSWTCPDGITFKSGFNDDDGYIGVEYYAAYQTFTADQWSKMEAAGAVFLPAAGDRYGSDVFSVQDYGSDVFSVQDYGNYWSATEYDGDSARYLYFYSGGGHMYYYSGILRNSGLSVRLVKDL